MFVALQHRNFRLLWFGQLISFSGSIMQTAAILWHVSLLVPGARGLALGLVGLVRVVPIVVFSLVSGVVADAFDRRKLMLVTQVTAGWWPWSSPPSPSAACPSSGRSTCSPRSARLPAPSTAPPARRSFRRSCRARSAERDQPQHDHVPGGVGDRAIARRHADRLARRRLGLLFNAVSFLAVIVALLMMRDVPVTTPRERAQPPSPRREGLRFVFRRRSSVRRCCSISSPRSSPRRPRCCRSSPRTCFTSARRATAGSTPPLGRLGAGGAIMVRAVDRIERRGGSCSGRSPRTARDGRLRAVAGFWLTFVCLAVTGAADTVSRCSGTSSVSSRRPIGCAAA